MKRIVLLSLLLFPIFLFAQYPTFSNKQKLGVQTTGDGLIYRGRNNPNYYTPSNINNAYFYLDTLTSKLYLYNISDWRQIYPTTSDTTSLGNFLLKSDTLAMLLPYLRKADTISLSNRINNKLNATDTVSLSNRINLKLNQTDTINLSNRIDLKLNKSDTISLSNRINTKLNTSDTVSLSNRINKKLDTLYVNYQTNVDTIVNKDTINITTLEAGLGINIANNIISLDTILLDSIVSIKNVYVKNGTGTILNKGEAVYVTGADGTNSTNIIVGRASNIAESSSSKTLGLTMTSIPVNGFGYVIKEGLLAGLNTNSANAGDPVWLSNTPGGLIFGLTNKPYAPNHLVYLGIVTRKQQNNGEIYVTVQNGFEIKELHDVQITDPVNKASLYYNSSENLWRDTTATLLVSDTTSMLSKYVNTYSNQTNINGDKTFNNIVTIDSLVANRLDVNSPISSSVKINSNTYSTEIELMNSGGKSYIKSNNKNITFQTDTTALVYLKGDDNRVGILTMSPQQALEVNGNARITGLNNNLVPTNLVGSSNNNDLTNINLGQGLSFTNDTLKVDLTIIDTAIAASSITLVGDVKGTGSTNSTVNTTINNGVVTNDMLAGGISDNKLNTITATGKVDNSATTATSSNNPNTIVLRDASRNFTANNITANNFYGLASTSTIANSIQSNNTTGIIKLTTSSNAVLPILTVPDVNATIATTNLNQTFGGTQTFTNTIIGNISGNAATVTSVTPSNFANQSANTVLAAPNGSSGTPSFRSLVSSDIPSLNYLPLTGGTLTGALNGTTGTFTGLNIVNPTTEAIFTLQGYDNNTPTRIQFKTTGNVRREIVLPTSDSNLEFRTSTIGGTQGGYSFYTRRNPNAEQLAFNIDYNGNSNFYGTLGVTGNVTANFSNTSNYSTSATDNNAFTVYNNTTSSNNIYGGIQFLIGQNSGAIPGGPGLAQIYAIRAGGVSDPSTDLSFITKGSSTLERLRIKFDGKVGIGTSTPSYLLDVNGQIGSTGFIKSGGTSSQFLKADGSVDANTYLTTGTAASTYLPLTGGTLTGTLNGINQNLTTNLSITDPITGNPPRIYTSVTTGPSSTASIRLALDQATSGGANMFMGGSQLVGGNSTNPNIFFTDSRRAYASIGGVYTGAGITSSGHIIFNTTPNDATTALTERMRITQDGKIGINTSSPSYNLEVNGSFNTKDFTNHTFVNYIQNGDFDLTSTIDASAFNYGYPYYVPLHWKSAATSRYVSYWSSTGGYNSPGSFRQYDSDASTGGALYQDVTNWQDLKGKTVTACGWFTKGTLINTGNHAEIQINDGLTTTTTSIGTTTTWQRACVTKTISASATRVRVIVGCNLAVSGEGGAVSDIDAISLVIGEGKHQFSPKPLFDRDTQRLSGTLLIGYDSENNLAYNPSATSNLKVAGSTSLNGTLGVSGVTTLSNLSGGSTRMVTASSTGVLSTQAIPTGTLVGTDTVSLSNRINGKVGLTGTETIAGTKTFLNLVNITNQMTISGSVEGTNKLLGKNTTSNGVGDITVGTGLTLTNNTLSATSTGTVTSVTASTPLSSSGGTTPNITITDASSTSSGVVNQSYQIFAGTKQFSNVITDILKVDKYASFTAPVEYTAANIDLLNNETIRYLIFNSSSNQSITLPNVANRRELYVKNINTGAVISNSSNVILLSGSSPQQNILSAGPGKWATLVSNGTNWIIMAGN